MMSFGKRLTYAFRCFFSLLFRGELDADIATELASFQKPASVGVGDDAAVHSGDARQAGAEHYDRAIQVLALLQREGRLIDFLTEDVSPYQDSQLGTAVRALHASCRQALDRYITIEPIMASEEGQRVTVQPGFDPSALKLIGNVTGQLPLSGLLRHRGWRATKVNLPPLPQESGRSVVAAAEIEIA